MKAMLAFLLSVCLPICYGRHFIPGHALDYVNKPRMPMRDNELSDEVCEDNPKYADGCPTYAAVENYCEDNEDFMRKNCPKSCRYCSQAATKPTVSTEAVKPPAPPATTEPAVSTEAIKPPAPVVCEDDPDYADACAEKAAIRNYCRDQKDFMRRHCAKSCNLCKETSTTEPAVSTEAVKPPAPPATTEPAVSTETAKPPAPVVCEDDPDYADACAEKAAIKNYCRDQKDFMRRHCAKSCNLCNETSTAQPTVLTETVRPPAPIVCADNPEFKDRCADIADTAGFCQEQEDFTKENCKLSCGWCVAPVTKPPIQEICDDDLPKWRDQCPKWAEAGECEIPRKQVFMEHYCRKSCKLPCKTEPSPIPATKPPSPPAFCRDRDVNCGAWKSFGFCDDPEQKLTMAIYCGVTCDLCKAPTPEECYDKGDNCEELKKDGYCSSTVPKMEYEVKTKCLETCEFCVPDLIP